MTTIRAVGTFCITLIICVGMVLGYMHVKTPTSELSFIKLNKGVLVFERKTQTVNYCTQKECVAVSANFLAQPKPQAPLTWVPCPAAGQPIPSNAAPYPPAGYMPAPQITPPTLPAAPAPSAPVSTPTPPAETADDGEEEEDDL